MIYQLPVEENPIIRCYRIHAYLLNIIGIPYKNEFDRYLISHYLALHNTYRGDYLDFHLENNYLNIREMFRDNNWFRVIQMHHFDPEDDSELSNIRECIVEFIKKGYYIVQNVDESCLKHTSKFGGVPVNNISMITGYDDINDAFYMLDYDAYGLFCVSSVPSNEYFHSVSQVTVSNRLNFVKAKENIDFSFDFEHSLKLLRCYLCSQNAYPDHVDYKNHVFGYEGVDMAFRDIHCLNMVDIRAILEHKNIMCKYFEYITNNGYLKKDTYVLMYKDIALQMKIIFLKIIKKILLYKNNRDYTTECDAIRRLNEKEAKLLEGYLLAL